MRKFIVVGLGSMGKRRIRILQKLMGNSVEAIGIDTSRKRCSEVEEKFGISVAESLEQALSEQNIEAAFISSPPLTHAEIIESCLQHGTNVFTELNLVSKGFEKNAALARMNDCTLFISSTMLYRKEIQYIVDTAHQYEGNLNYRYHVAQYLPDWHPWDKLSDFFISKKETNGCRELLAIELPWLVEAFGNVQEVKTYHDRMSELPIDYDDNYLLLLKHKSGHKGMLAVDVVCRETMREFTLFGENLFIKWNGSPTGLYCKDLSKDALVPVECYQEGSTEQMNGYNNSIIENAYIDEVRNFLDVLDGDGTPRYSMEKDARILELIDRIEGNMP